MSYLPKFSGLWHPGCDVRPEDLLPHLTYLKRYCCDTITPSESHRAAHPGVRNDTFPSVPAKWRQSRRMPLEGQWMMQRDILNNPSPRYELNKFFLQINQEKNSDTTPRSCYTERHACQLFADSNNFTPWWAAYSAHTRWQHRWWTRVPDHLLHQSRSCKLDQPRDWWPHCWRTTTRGLNVSKRSWKKEKGLDILVRDDTAW